MIFIKFLFSSIFNIFLLVLIHFYTYKAINTAFKSSTIKLILKTIFWSSLFIIVSGIAFAFVVSPFEWKLIFRYILITTFLCDVLFCIIVSLFLLFEDFKRLFFWVKGKFFDLKKEPENTKSNFMSRSTFISKVALGVASLPVIAIINGIARNAYRYRKHFIDLSIKNLPASFHELKIVQISDIHSGSFTRPDLVQRGVNMILEEKPDLVFFTGDLVNFKSEEIDDYIDIFKQVKAKLGVYSILGNHDYGDYFRWESPEAKEKNMQHLYNAHKKLGWQLLIDEHVKIEQGNDKIAVLGVGNWGKGFSRRGKLDKAYAGCNDCNTKLLLSHDPSHWEAEVLKNYSDIDVMFAGHTHGMQFGIEIPGFIKWSPIKYAYKQWAGLYEKENGQKLYVNRGFGFHAMPGRVGILPEITVFTLKQA